MAETLGGPSPEREAGTKTIETREEIRRKRRERKKQRKREQRRNMKSAPAGGSRPDVTTSASPAPDVKPVSTTPDTKRKADPVTSPDIHVIPPPDILRTSPDDDDDDDASIDVLLPIPPAPPDRVPPILTPDIPAEPHYIFLPKEEGVDDKVVKALKKAGGTGLTFAWVGALGILGHGFRIAAKKTHHLVDGLLYFLEKWVYDKSGAKNSIPWKWFTKEPEEPEYKIAEKREAELLKHVGGKDKKK